jgi:hypothetical protein
MAFDDVGNALLGTSRIFAEKRNQIIQQDLAIESAKMLNTWQDQANTNLLKSESEDPDGWGFEDKQKQWYENNVTQFADNIRDDRVRKNFIANIQTHQANYRTKAAEIGLTKIKEKQQSTWEDSLATYAGSIYSAAPEHLDSTLEGEVLPGLNLQKSTFNPALLKASEPGVEAIFKMYADRKVQDLQSKLINRTMTTPEYKLQIEGLRNRINKDEIFKGVFKAETLMKLNDTLFDMQEHAEERIQGIVKENLENDTDGYIQAIKDGKPRNLLYEEQYLNFSAEDPGMKMNYDKIQAVVEMQDFYLASRNGDLAEMEKQAAAVTAQAQETDAFGSDYEIQQLKAATITADYTKKKALYIENTAEALKDNPDLKMLKLVASQIGDYSSVVKKTASLATAQGTDPGNVEFLTNAELEKTSSFINEATPDQLESMVGQLQKKFDVKFSGDHNAINNVINQIVGYQTKTGVAAEKALLLHYNNTAHFNFLAEATKVNIKDAAKNLPAGMTEAKIRTQINAKFDSFFDTIRAQRPENVGGQITAYSDLATKAAIQALQDPATGATDLNSAVKVAKDYITGQYTIIDKDYADVLVRYPKDRAIPAGTIDRILGHPNVKDAVLDRVILKAGDNPKLVGDINDLIDQSQISFASRKSFSRQDLIDNAKIYNNADGSGISIYANFNGTLLPLRLKGYGTASLSWEELASLQRQGETIRREVGDNKPAAYNYLDDLVKPGNIDVNNRPVVENKDGSISTVRSISVEMDGKNIVLPTVINGQIVSDEEAVNHYRQTGEHLGIFSSSYAANKFARALHKEQDKTYRK